MVRTFVITCLNIFHMNWKEKGYIIHIRILFDYFILFYFGVREILNEVVVRSVSECII